MAAIDAQGTTFTINSQTVGGIISFSGFDGEASDIDITTLASTAKEFRQGLQDFGNFTFELIRDPNDAGQAQMLTQKAAQTASTCVLSFPDDVTLNVATFTAYVKSLSTSGSVDEVARGTGNLKITGSVAWTDESA